MHKKIFDKKNDILVIQRNIALIVLLLVIIIAVFQSIALSRKETTTILVPFGFSDKITISSKTPHNDYLEAISRDIIYTMLNLTPNNLDYAEKSVLSNAHGSAYGKLKNQMEELKRNVASRKFSTAFYPIAIYPDSSTLTVIIDGTLHTFFGQKEVSKDKKRYEIKYNYTAGRLSIVGFSEIIEETQDNNK